jgi:hypothetical protein
MYEIQSVRIPDFLCKGKRIHLTKFSIPVSDKQIGISIGIFLRHCETIDYKGKTELPYNPPQAMLLHAGRGQVVRYPVDITHFPFPYRLRASHTHFRVHVIHMDF